MSCDLGEDTEPHLVTNSFHVAVERENVFPQTPFVQNKPHKSKDFIEMKRFSATLLYFNYFPEKGLKQKHGILPVASFHNEFQHGILNVALVAVQLESPSLWRPDPACETQ